MNDIKQLCESLTTHGEKQLELKQRSIFQKYLQNWSMGHQTQRLTEKVQSLPISSLL